MKWKLNALLNVIKVFLYNTHYFIARGCFNLKPIDLTSLNTNKITHTVWIMSNEQIKKTSIDNQSIDYKV